MRSFAAAAFLCWLSFAGSTAAEPVDGSTRQAARQHFEAALSHLRLGDIAAALREFQAAYELQPHFSVLYNIGQAHAAMGDPVEAVRALEEYLARGRGHITEPRLNEVQQILKASRERMGRLQLLARDAATRAWLDGKEVASGDPSAPIDLAVGKHQLIYSRSGEEPTTRAFIIDAGRTTMLELPPRSPTTFGSIEVDCEVPDVDVKFGPGISRRTPVKGAFFLPVARYEVSFSRAGYVPRTLSVQLHTGQVTRVGCDLTPDPSVPSTLRGALEVRVPRSAIVHVDGRPYRDKVMPVGRHAVLVERDGFEPQRSSVLVEHSKIAVVEPVLQPTRVALARQQSRAERRTAGVLMLGTGAASMATAITIYVWNSGRVHDWQNERMSTSSGADFDRVAGLQRADDAALGALLLGAGLGLGAAWLLGFGD